MKQPTKEECRLAANEDQKSFQRLGTYQRSLLEKYCESTQILGYDGRWLLRGGQQTDLFNPGAIYRLNPAAAEPEDPTEDELGLCRNRGMRALCAMPELAVAVLAKYPHNVQALDAQGLWGYTHFVGAYRNAVYRLVAERGRAV